MGTVNRFNVNGEQATLDADIIENMSANDVSYDSSFQYDENSVGDKLSELDKSYNTNESDKLYICDVSGNVIASFDADGLSVTDISILKDGSLKNIIDIIEEFHIEEEIKEVVRQEIAKLPLIDDVVTNDEFLIADKNGYVIFSANKDGVNYIGKNEGEQSSAKVDSGHFPTDIIINFYYGRSLSYHGTLTSSDSRHNNLAFKQSQYSSYQDMLLMITDSNVDDKSFLDSLFEGFRSAPTTANVIIANKAFSEFLTDENAIDMEFKDVETLTPNYDCQFLGFNPAEVAEWPTLANDEKLPMKRLRIALTYAKKFADQMGKTISVGACCFAHGEDTAGTSSKTRHDCSWVMASKINAICKEIMEQDNDIFFIPYQVASTTYGSYVPNNAKGDLDLCCESGLAPEGYVLDSTAATYLPSGVSLINRDQIQMGPIMCALSYKGYTDGGTDQVHATEKSYHAMAAQYGLQMKRCIYDGNPITPIHPINTKVMKFGDKWSIRVKMYVPTKPLVFDTDGGEVYSDRAKSPNFGFTLHNTSGIDIIESVSIVRGEEINVVVTQNPSGLILHYAEDGWMTGGNLRDSQNIHYYDRTIGDYYIHNWCPILQIQIN